MSFIIVGIVVYISYYYIVHKLLPYIGYWMYMEANKGD